MLSEGPLRKLLRERGVLKRFSSSQISGVDAELERLREAKKKEWLVRGYSPALIEKALLLADGWISSLADAYTPPGRPDVREAIIRGSYDKALTVGENWIISMMK